MTGLFHVFQSRVPRQEPWPSSYRFTAALWKLQILNLISQLSAKLKLKTSKTGLPKSSSSATWISIRSKREFPFS